MENSELIWEKGIANIRGKTGISNIGWVTTEFVLPEMVQYFTIMAECAEKGCINKWSFMGKEQGEGTELDSCPGSII